MCQSKVILLVDDDADCRSLVTGCILAAIPGADVREAGGGCDALDFLRRQGRHSRAPRPDLILMDVEMSDMNGLSVLQSIKSDPVLKDIPVVMLTGQQEPKLVYQAVRDGADGYSVKHANPKAFFRNVRAIAEYWLGGPDGQTRSNTGHKSGRIAG